MSKRSPIFLSALMLTAVHLFLRFVGTSFQVYISNRIGAAGLGLLQMVSSVGMLSTIAGMAGIRTGTMYLTAEELGKNSLDHVPWVLSGCFRYSIFFSCSVAIILYTLSPFICAEWIGDLRTEPILKLYAAFLPVFCMSGVMAGLYTAANKIGILAIVEIAEQLISITTTVLALSFFSGTSPVKACVSVILGGCIGSMASLVILLLLYGVAREPIERIPVAHRVIQTALPLAAADVLKSGINTVENLMVPNRLRLNPFTSDPMAAFGRVTGMVFPIMMFPCCILYALAELLIPELARCSAAGSRTRITYLVKRSLKIAMLYGLLFGGLIYLTAETLCSRLYHEDLAVDSLRQYSLLIPVLYCDTITDAMTKGLGQQKVCVRYNIITSAMDVILLYYLLPKYGMEGYYLSFLITHLINFLLSLRRLMYITSQKIPFFVISITVLGSAAAIMLSNCYSGCIGRILLFPATLFSILYLLGVIHREDIFWVTRLLYRNEKTIA